MALFVSIIRKNCLTKRKKECIITVSVGMIQLVRLVQMIQFADAGDSIVDYRS